MPEVILNAARREVLGKKTRLLRHQGLTPAHLFGHNIKSQALQCNTTELLKTLAHSGTTRLVSLNIEGDKEPRNVFVREIQRDILSRQLLHVDFYQVKKGEKMEMDIPIVLIGEAPAMKGKGRMLSRGIDELKIECLPDKVPPQIEVDISGLTELEEGIFVKDIILDPEIIVHTDLEQLIVKVTEVVIKVEEEIPVIEEAEVPVEEAEGEEGIAKPEAEAAAEKPERAQDKE